MNTKKDCFPQPVPEAKRKQTKKLKIEFFYLDCTTLAERLHRVCFRNSLFEQAAKPLPTGDAAMTVLEKFDIRNLTDRLEPAKEKGKYICPVCEGHNLSIDEKSGKYQCFNGCECKDIREAIRPWVEVQAQLNGQKGSNYSSKNLKSSKPKTVRRSAIALPEDFELVVLPQPASDIPQAQPVTTKPPKGIPNDATQVTYFYSPEQWIVRYQWTDPNKEKGYDKSFRQWHRLPDGTPEMRKGEEPWAAYRIEEAIAAGAATGGTPALLQHEGEGCVEIGRANGLASFTFQGSAWDKKSILPDYQLLKDSGIGLIIFLHDPDETGLKKLATCQECADEVGIALIGINPYNICPGLPYKSADIKEILEQMEVPEFIRLLEAEIQLAVNARQAAKNHINNDANADESDETGTTFLQQAYQYLYGDKPWINANDELYYHVGNHYKHSPDSKERRRISNFCNRWAEKDANEKLTYPYASPNWVKKVLEWAKMRTEIDPELLNPPGVNCTNGIVRTVWDGKEFIVKLDPHTPDDYFIYEPLIEYNPDADPKYCDQLLSCLDKPQQEIFLRNLAASLDLPTVRKLKGREIKALLAVGLGSNGKDALRECVSTIYGDYGLASVSLSDFQLYDEGRKFNLSPLINIRVNWASENPQTCRIDKIQSLKLFVTGNKLHCERKGKDHIEFTPNAVGIFNLNETPSFLGAMQAIQDRIAVLEFKKTFTKNPNPDNPNELKADPRFAYDKEFIKTKVAPAFLNKMLKSLNDLINEGIDYECTTEAFKNLQKDNNHLFDFFESANIGYVDGGEISAGALWMLLEQWYIQTGTLTIDPDNNRRSWIDQVRPSDKNVKGINQVIPRILQLFPKATKGTKYCDVAKRSIPVIKGIGIIENTRTTIENTRTTPAPLPAPETQSPQASRTTRTTFSDFQENIEEGQAQQLSLLPPMNKEENIAQTGAGSAEALQGKENWCGEPCGSGAGQPQSGAGEADLKEVELLDSPISLLQSESEGYDINEYIGCLVEVRSLSGAVKFAGEMVSYDKTHGTITVVTEEGNRDVYLREAFVIG